ncbi:hypothetical protein ACS0TY_008977 [Phlomoides rotata]
MGLPEGDIAAAGTEEEAIILCEVEGIVWVKMGLPETAGTEEEAIVLCEVEGSVWVKMGLQVNSVPTAATLHTKMKCLWCARTVGEVARPTRERVVYAWVGDDPCGDGDLPPWSGVTCSTVSGSDYRVVTELEVCAVSIVGPFPLAVTNLVDLIRLDLHNNKLTGPIPYQIGRLKHLKILA